MSDLEIRSPGQETTTAWALASTENWDTTTTTAWALASTNNWATTTETPCTTTTAWALASTENWDTTTTTAWALASTNGWATTTPCTTSSWITSTTKPCTTTSTTSCTTTTSSTTTRCGLCGDSRATAAPATYTNSNGQVVAVKHDNGGLAPGIVGAIVIGVFFGILLIALLCIFCFRAARSRAYYEEDDDSEDSRRRPPRPIDPYGGRPMTFVGGGSRPETKVVITRQQRMFVRPPVARTRRERVVVVEED
ncbi:hypothetical protein LTR10_021854 [Elasticomyces elasticus]|uniref:Mid2 domain-containing protein n=1 Tax=Exophiala sideris TaxID=1016849 RepID=A0ABR0JGV3_9EURO|nr:hypothetical protein LTR10_021854 [Elasticomyces elasticus]KAK5025286.1 hypothetical protein LTS07_008137 [Exophiala sideris]KAK5029165.1 hypothetical protein LTR13_008702 [Exophiala sideris]KAK5063346.1 hypothetical protein LTR69_004052 [Exophiala sideris]KAK5179061.1 hypothetical protein LTR44_008550 [Eurotiomycetes sp. CCFEE 6388]